MNATQIATCLADRMGIDVRALTHEGTAYVITTGTGDGSFAYYAELIESWLTDEETLESPHYDDLCAAHDPVDDDAELARAIYSKLDISIDRAGTCSPVVENIEPVCWLYDNVDGETWDRLVGSQTREEFAALCDDDIEIAWAEYVEHMEAM